MLIKVLVEGVEKTLISRLESTDAEYSNMCVLQCRFARLSISAPSQDILTINLKSVLADKKIIPIIL